MARRRYGWTVGAFGLACATFAWAVRPVPSQAQTADEAARFVFGHVTLNAGAPEAFNADGQALTVGLAGPCEIQLERNVVFTDTRIGPSGLFGRPGPREEINPRVLTETAVIRLDQVLLQNGTTVAERLDEQRLVVRFRFPSDSGAVRSRTVRLSQRIEEGQTWIVPDGYDDLAWPDLQFSTPEAADEAGRHKAALEYFIGRFCAGKRSAY